MTGLTVPFCRSGFGWGPRSSHPWAALQRTPSTCISPWLTGLFTFWIGALAGSTMHVVVRGAAIVAWLVLTVFMGQANLPSYLPVVSAAYFAVSIAMGAWAVRSLGRGRFRILTWFSLGYLVGSVAFKVQGLVVAARRWGASLARRSLGNKPQPPHSHRSLRIRPRPQYQLLTHPTVTMPHRHPSCRAFSIGLMLLSALAATARGAEPPAKAAAIFDGKSLKGWKVLDVFDFKRHGEVTVKAGAIELGKGRPASGIAYTGQAPV